jgi:hypothetical protein
MVELRRQILRFAVFVIRLRQCIRSEVVESASCTEYKSNDTHGAATDAQIWRYAASLTLKAHIRVASVHFKTFDII